MGDIERVEKALLGVVFSQAEQERFQKLAGFVASQLGHVAREGETFVWRGYNFEVLDINHHWVDKVLVSTVSQATGDTTVPRKGKTIR